VPRSGIFGCCGAAVLGLCLTDGTAKAQEGAERAGAITCTPEVRELQTRRPLPLECHADAEVVRMTLRYRERGTSDWATVELRRHEGGFRGQVPCLASMNAGAIDLFVVATDSQGDPVDTLGSKNHPLSFRVDARSPLAPAYPGEEPPERCAERVECPPDFPGCEDADASERAARADSARNRPLLTHWLGVHVAGDVGFMGGSNVCANSNHDFDCFDAGTSTPYPAPLPPGVAAEVGELGDVYPGTGIDTGAALGTWRLLLSFDQALSERVSLGARLGYAFGGGPATQEGKSFLPVHIEARVSYWLRALSASGVRPYLHLGGGIAEVDVKKSNVSVRDCSEEPTRDAFLDCINALGAYDPANNPELPSKTLDVYSKLGNAFVTTGGGALIGLGDNTGLQLNLNAMLMLPTVGVVLEPSLGIVYGF
jgi:hypothetical protein